MRTTSFLKIFMVMSIVLIINFIACDDDNPTGVTDEVAGYKIEDVQPGKLNAYPILGYMKSGAKLAPEIDGYNDDLIWDAANPFDIQLDPDENGYAPTVQLRALYDNWYIYLLAEWEDDTEDISPNVWWYGNPDENGTTDVAVFDTIYTVWVTEDSSYKPQRHPVKRATGPESWSNWTTNFNPVMKTTTYEAKVTISLDGVSTLTWDTTYVTYDTLKFSGSEDGLTFMWNTNVTNFLNCSNLCHANNSIYTDMNEVADVWSWYSYRTNFKKTADDLSLQETGFVGDQGAKCFVLNYDTENDLPKNAYLDHPYSNTDVLYDTSAVPYYPKVAWFSGHYIPGYVLQDPTDSRADIFAEARHSGSKWILELRRKLQTQPISLSKDNSDIQFNPDSEADVSFHLVAFNNARGKNHAFTSAVQVMHFLQLVE